MLNSSRRKHVNKPRRDVLLRFPFIDETNLENVIYPADGSKTVLNSEVSNKQPIKSKLIQVFKHKREKETKRRESFLENELQKIIKDKQLEKISKMKRSAALGSKPNAPIHKIKGPLDIVESFLRHPIIMCIQEEADGNNDRGFNADRFDLDTLSKKSISYTD